MLTVSNHLFLKNHTLEYKTNGFYCQSSNGILEDVPFTAIKGFNFTMAVSHGNI